MTTGKGSPNGAAGPRGIGRTLKIVAPRKGVVKAHPRRKRREPEKRI